MSKYIIKKDWRKLHPSLKVGATIEATEFFSQGQTQLKVNKVNGKVLPRTNKPLIIQSMYGIQKVTNTKPQTANTSSRMMNPALIEPVTQPAKVIEQAKPIESNITEQSTKKIEDTASKTNNIIKKDNVILITSSIGALGGLGLAYKQKKSFWGYVGYFLLGSIAGSLVGNIIGGSMSDLKDSSTNTGTGSEDLSARFNRVTNEIDSFIKANPKSGTTFSKAILTEKYNKAQNDNERKFMLDFMEMFLKASKEMQGKTPEQSFAIFGTVMSSASDLAKKYNISEDRARQLLE